MKENIDRRVVSLVLLALFAIMATACGGGASAASDDTSAASGVVAPVAPSDPVNPGPAQVTLGDGLAGVAGSRFTDPDI